MKNSNLGILILRVSLAAMMFLHGLAKLSKGVDGIGNMLVAHGLPYVLAYGVFLGEVVAPLAIFLGYRTRGAALVLASTCIVAALLSHSEDIFSRSANGGWAIELLGLFFFGSVSLFFTGAGRYALSTKNKWD
jgi:putative oxidoreductase